MLSFFLSFIVISFVNPYHKKDLNTRNKEVSKHQMKYKKYINCCMSLIGMTKCWPDLKPKQTFTCLKSAIEALEKGVGYVQS